MFSFYFSIVITFFFFDSGYFRWVYFQKIFLKDGLDISVSFTAVFSVEQGRNELTIVVIYIISNKLFCTFRQNIQVKAHTGDGEIKMIINISILVYFSSSWA